MRLQRIRIWRLALASCYLFSDSCKADYRSIKQQLKESIEQAIKDAQSDEDLTDFTNRPSLLEGFGAGDGFKSAQGDGTDKEFAEPMATSIEKLNGYGCWCYLREEYVRGRGKPKNEVDQLCKTMALGYDCAIIDGEQEGEDPCPEPWNIQYDAVIGGHHMQDIFGACGVLNPRNKCKQMACAIEGHFVSELMATMMALGGKIDLEYYHKKGKGHAIPGYGKKQGWDPDEPGNCVWETGTNTNDNVSEQEEEEEDEEHTANGGGGKGNGGGNGSNGHLDDDIDSISGTQATLTTTKMPTETTRQCCGDWPKRHPYHTRNGQKACCGKRTYDNTFLSCCKEDHLRVVCKEDLE